MADKRLRRRTPLRFKQIRKISDQVEGLVGRPLNLSECFLEEAHFEGVDLILTDRTPCLMCLQNRFGGNVWFPTLRGLLKWSLERHYVEVDHGAIPFLMNGANCMAAGIQNSDPDIESDMPVWIRDEVHGRPLAVGWSLMTGEEMLQAGKGKGVRTIHWVGDDLWNLDSS